MYLFTPQLAKNDGFIAGLRIDTVKNAFRKKAKQYHPDLHLNEPEEMIKKRKERFINIQKSYSYLINSINLSSKIDQNLNKGWGNSHYTQNKTNYESKNQSSQREKYLKKIIAVGGSKGGIGRSIFSVNLAITLSQMGFETVIVDLDLGGANLHLFLGEQSLKWNLSNFLTNKALSLQDIMVTSKYGPHFIGGDSSLIGSANINLNLKMKLINAIKSIKADYIILDLGGNTTNNTIDFFLSASYRIVLTTCNPAAYFEAYNFIKFGLYRKLDRLFEPESKYHSMKDSQLEYLIHNFINQMKVGGHKTVNELIDRVHLQQPENEIFIKNVINLYQPLLVVNKVQSEIKYIQIVNRIQDTIKKNLCTQIYPLGNISLQLYVEKSTQALVPVVSKYPDSPFAGELKRITENLLKIKYEVHA